MRLQWATRTNEWGIVDVAGDTRTIRRAALQQVLPGQGTLVQRPERGGMAPNDPMPHRATSHARVSSHHLQHEAFLTKRSPSTVTLSWSSLPGPQPDVAAVVVDTRAGRLRSPSSNVTTSDSVIKEQWPFAKRWSNNPPLRFRIV